jgi:hypothetical protein
MLLVGCVDVKIIGDYRYIFIREAPDIRLAGYPAG